MKEKRAMEIMNSTGVIEVRHRELPVWIEQVDQDKAEIKYLDTDIRAEVPIHELSEHKG